MHMLLKKEASEFKDLRNNMITFKWFTESVQEKDSLSVIKESLFAIFLFFIIFPYSLM